jgi:hypothetical protein
MSFFSAVCWHFCWQLGERFILPNNLGESGQMHAYFVRRSPRCGWGKIAISLDFMEQPENQYESKF